MSSGGTPFIPLSNLTGGHLIPVGQEGHLSVPGASRLANSNFNLRPPGFRAFFLFSLPGEVSFPAGVGGECTAMRSIIMVVSERLSNLI